MPNSPEQNVRLKEWFEKKYSDPEWKANRNARRAEFRRKNKTKAVEFMGNKCFRCGQSFPDCCYDFHHKDPLDNNEIPSGILHCSWKRIIEELSKCIMVCSNCHRIIHNEDGYIAHTKRKDKYV